MSKTPFTDTLKEYREQKAAGVDYIECPRCHGSRYVYAVSEERLDDYRRTLEEFPCPLCVTVTDIDIDKAIEWLKDKAEFEEGYDEDEENAN